MSKTPLGDFFGNEEIRQMERDNSHCWDERSDAAMLAHRERPYLGQSHTQHGERGRHIVAGLTMRDIADCIARGMRQAARTQEEFDACPFSLEAGIQNTMVNLEKMMGIFPNVPGLEQPK